MKKTLPANPAKRTLPDVLARASQKAGPKPRHRPRLVFGLDATASRQPTWDTACQHTAAMFDAVPAGLDVQLAYYRGTTPPVASPWVNSARQLTAAMTGVTCQGGFTQLGKLMDHVIRQHHEARVNAFVFIGDSHEEQGEMLVKKATELGAYRVPIFLFHENPGAISAASFFGLTTEPDEVTRTFQLMAERSGGVYLPFDQHSADRFRDLLAGIAAYAAGGRAALAARPDDAAKLLLQHLK